MDFEKVVVERYSSRKYKDIDVDNEIIKKIIEIGTFAPSAKNRQPWKIAVLRGENKNKIAKLMNIWWEKNKLTAYKGCSVGLSASVIEQAPVLICIFKEEGEYINSDVLSIGAMIEHVCLAATNFGLGSLWIADVRYVMKEISDFLNVPHMELSSCISVGYPEEVHRKRNRKKMEDIIIQFDNK